QRVKDNVMVNGRLPDEGLKSFHRQYLQKATESLFTQRPGERLSRTESIAIDVSLLKEAEALMDEFAEKLNQLADRSPRKTDVYNLSCHFFNLTSKGDKKS